MESLDFLAISFISEKSGNSHGILLEVREFVFNSFSYFKQSTSQVLVKFKIYYKYIPIFLSFCLFFYVFNFFIHEI